MTSIHTKLKELRDFDRDAVNSDFFDEKDYLCRNDCAYSFVNGASYQHRKQLTLISALEKAVERLEDIGTTKIAFGPERVSSCSADEAKEALAEIAAMLEKD